jgi:Tol biopolymer transport system component
MRGCIAGLDAGPAVALSPDGTHLAYVATQGGTQQIYMRAMDSLESRPLPGTEGAVEPFFSPDGQWLGFFASGKMKKISVNGGAAKANSFHEKELRSQVISSAEGVYSREMVG